MDIKNGKQINPKATLELNESLYKENMDIFSTDNQTNKKNELLCSSNTGRSLKLNKSFLNRI